MRAFILTSILAVGCSLAGCAGELQNTKAEPAIQLVVGAVTNPTVAPQQQASPSTVSYTISVSVTLDPEEVPDGSADGQEQEQQQ